MGVSIPVPIKARPISGRGPQRRQQTILVITAMLLLGMIMLRGELIVNLRVMFPSALDASANPAPVESPHQPAPVLLATAPTPPPAEAKKQLPSQAQLPKVALLFLTRGPMPLEPIWRDFLGVGDQPYKAPLNKTIAGTPSTAWQKYFSMYVHTTPGFKYPKGSLFAPYTVDSLILADWGRHSIIDAERKLLQEALKDPLNQFFVLLSETHVPLYPLDVTYLQLVTAKRSRVHACGNATEEDQARRMTYRMSWEFAGTRSGVNEDTWQKSSQWFGLIRSHAQLVAEEKIVNEAFERYCYVEPSLLEDGEYDRFCVSDEHYIPTMLSVYKLEKECACDGHSTRVIWIGNLAHPKSFGKADATMATLLYELRGEHEAECQNSKILERSAGAALEKIDTLLEGKSSGGDDADGAEVDVSDLNGEELIKYVMTTENVSVMQASCPLFARKIEADALKEWRKLLKPMLQPTPGV